MAKGKGKYLSVELLKEAAVTLFFECWYGNVMVGQGCFVIRGQSLLTRCDIGLLSTFYKHHFPNEIKLIE